MTIAGHPKLWRCHDCRELIEVDYMRLYDLEPPKGEIIVYLCGGCHGSRRRSVTVHDEETAFVKGYFEKLSGKKLEVAPWVKDGVIELREAAGEFRQLVNWPGLIFGILVAFALAAFMWMPFLSEGK